MKYQSLLHYRSHNLFVCLGFLSHSRIFHSCGDVTIVGEGLQSLTCARHSWPLSSEGSLACHTYCDTGHLFVMVISEDPWHSPIAERSAVELPLPVFTTKVCPGWDTRTPNLLLVRRTFYPTAPHRIEIITSMMYLVTCVMFCIVVFFSDCWIRIIKFCLHVGLYTVFKWCHQWCRFFIVIKWQRLLT